MAEPLWSSVLEAAALGAGLSSWDELLSAPRYPRIVMRKQIALMIVRRCWGCSYPELTELAVAKEYTTVRSAILTATERLKAEHPLWVLAFEEILQAVPEKLRALAASETANEALSTWKRPT